MKLPVALPVTLPVEYEPNRSKKKQMKLNEDGIVLFPTYAYYHQATDEWRVKIHGCCYHVRHNSKRKYIAKRIVTKILGFSQDVWENSTFTERINPFFADPISGAEVILDVAGREFKGTSENTGHFYFEASIIQEELKQYSVMNKVEVVAKLAENPAINYQSSITVIPEKGKTVISDIDDTIKMTEVSQQKSLAKNILINPYEVIPGMDHLYDNLRNKGNYFHYVSLSPWQLFLPLLKMLNENKMPMDSIHLREFHWKQIRSWEKLKGNPQEKKTAINKIITDFPLHQFTLVGDIGEVDPEIYAELYKVYPEQIAKILIRSHGDHDDIENRIDQIYSNIPEEKWLLFENPQEIST